MCIGFHVKCPLFLSDFNFLDGFAKNPRVPNFMKIRPVGAELFHADGQTRGQIHGEANILFSQICERARKCKLKTRRTLSAAVQDGRREGD